MKFYPRIIAIALALCALITPAFSQTIAVANFDNSVVYAPGSSIGVPFHIDNSTGGCIGSTNTFSLFLSDPTGTTYSSTPLATVSGFYATYINAVIPAGTLPGAGYKVKITASSNPSATIVESAPFTIAVGTAISAGVEPTNSQPRIPDEVFGVCDKPQPTFDFQYISKSTAGTTGSVMFINESTNAVVTINSLSGSFTAQQTNYTAVVKAGNGLVNGTRAYTILNNPINNNIGSSSSTSGCLQNVGASVVLTYIVNTTQLQSNFPGNTYRVSWGDGTATSTYSICDLLASGGAITHTFTKSSCGNSPQAGRNNVFEIDIQPISPFCGVIGTPASTYANITLSPQNKITGPVGTACSGTVTFTNNSYPGEDPSSTANNCKNFSGALYSWFLDGAPVSGYLNVPITKSFAPTLASGNHVITLHLTNNPTSCAVQDGVYNICIQDPPKPSFTLSAGTVCASTGVAITNTSVIDNTCTAPVYNWTVTGPAGSTVTPTGGTTFNSFEPKFVFSAAGVYTIRLSMPDACGGNVLSAPITVNVDTNPTVTLPANAFYCGSQTLTFNSTNGSATRVVYAGSATANTPTYLWTITPSAGAAPATFINGTSASSQFPQISFPGFGSYTVSVNYTNSCGSPIATETINIQEAPKVSAGPDGTVCAAAGSFSPTGSIDDMSKIVSYQWRTNGDGTFTNGTSSLTPIYNLGPNDKKGGTILLTLDTKTNLVGNCSTVQSSMNLIVTPIVTITSSASNGICSGNGVGYTITSNLPGTTYAWTATASANVTGSSGGGTSATLTDVLVNSDPVNNGTVTYTITPTANGCAGTPFTFTVTVYPLPVLTLSDITSLCSGKPAGIVLDPAMKYSYTSTVISGTATGNKQQAIAINTTGINDVLTNTGTMQAVVKYTITPVSANGCAGNPVDVKVTVEPNPTQPVFNNPTAAVCDVTSYQLSATNPIVGTGLWTETTGKSVTFADATNPSTIVSGLVSGTTYTFKWTISTPCTSNSASFQLTDNLPSVGGTTSALATTICYNSSGTITLSGQVGNIIAWQQSTDGGVSWQTISGNNTNTSYNYTNLIQTTAFRAVVVNGSCVLANSAQTTITVSPPTVIPNAGADQTLCNQNTATLSGNSPGTSSGTWTQTAGPNAGVIITNPTSPTTTVTGLTGGNTYTFTWTIIGQPPCGNLTDDMVITDQSLMTNTITHAGNNTICAGTSITITGSTPTGGASPYTFTWESSTNNGTTWALINGQTSQNLTASPAVATQYRRTVFSSQQICSVISNIVSITTQAALANNSISSTFATVCYNTAPGLITGSTPTGGDGIYFYRWQKSTDGVTFTDIALATGKDYQPAALTVTTVYKRFVSTTLCSGVLGSESNTLTITVTPQLVAKFTANQTTGCSPFNINAANIQATSDNNAQTYTWYAGNTSIGTGLIFPGYTLTGEGSTVTIKLVVSSKIGCADESFSMNFSAPIQTKAGFTMNKTTGCGPQTVTFVNTSAPQNAGSTYLWDFGDGTTSTAATPPPHTFQPDVQGRDIKYTITLTANGCAPTTASQSIIVYPAQPVPIIDPGPLKGCNPYAITVKNLTLGTNVKYDYYLYDGNTPVQSFTRTDKSDVTFTPVGSTSGLKTYQVYMIATGPCGQTAKSVVFPISITPSGTQARMNVTPVNGAGIPESCAPFVATFNNLSTGGNSYIYNVYDSNFKAFANIPTTTPSITYTFPTAGTYYVDIVAISDCSTPSISPQIKVVVDPLPAPDFTANNTKGCNKVDVQFTNTTPNGTNAPAASYTYTWDFGDGTRINAFSPTHTFAYRATPYTVTLTAVNAYGCSATTTKVEYISVYPPPQTDFITSPDSVTFIPNYTLKFTDNSKVPGVSWFWDFGDKTTSTQRDPSHTYADTGVYKVTLVSYTQYGCTDSKTHIVRVKGIPGQLYVPNAFMPTSLSPELRVFTVKGSGLRSWSMRIFNIWGQMVFETTKLNARGEPVEFWDGRFKGLDALQGAYAWEIKATFLNGTDWKGMSYKGGTPKKAGTLNLIR